MSAGLVGAAGTPAGESSSRKTVNQIISASIQPCFMQFCDYRNRLAGR